MNVLLICKKRSRLFFHFLVHVSLEIYLKMTTENIYEKKNVLIYLCTCSERKHVFEIDVHVRNNCQGFLRRRTNGPGGACAPRTPLSAPNGITYVPKGHGHVRPTAAKCAKNAGICVKNATLDILAPPSK